ncbi:MAG: HypC/HybG/HupF family hydrogenase formation chaperone [Chloroflexota bacterium]
MTRELLSDAHARTRVRTVCSRAASSRTGGSRRRSCGARVERFRSVHQSPDPGERRRGELWSGRDRRGKVGGGRRFGRAGIGGLNGCAQPGSPGGSPRSATRPGSRWARWTSAACARTHCLSVPAQAKLGDYVIVHVGFAISKVDEAEALKTLQILDEMGVMGELMTLGPGMDEPAIISDDDPRSWCSTRPSRRRPCRARPHEVPRRVPRPRTREEAPGRDPPDHDAPVDPHGGLRRPDAHDRQAGSTRRCPKASG